MSFFVTLLALLPVALLALPTGFDILVLEDTSSPFLFRGNVATGMKSFFTEVLRLFPDSRFKIATFSDTPLPPFGCDNPGYKDHCYDDRTDWITDIDKAYYKLRKARYAYGVDTFEGSSMAMNFAARTKFEENSNGRVMVVVTDNAYHREGVIAELLEEPDRYQSHFCVNATYCCNVIDDLVTANVQVVPNRNGANNFLECGYGQDGSYTKVFEDFPNEMDMYKTIKEKRIALIGLVMAEINSMDIWFNYNDLMDEQGGIMTVRYGGDLTEDQKHSLKIMDYGLQKTLRKKVTESKAEDVSHNLKSAFEEVVTKMYEEEEPTEKPTEKPVVEETEPEEATEEPEETEKPVVEETEMPVVEETEPVVEVTEKPVVEVTEKPVVEETEPVVEVTEPVVEVTEPVVEVTEPVVEVTEKPVVEETEKPVVEETEKPVEVTEKPVVEPTKEPEEATEEPEETEKPVVEETEAETEPATTTTTTTTTTVAPLKLVLTHRGMTGGDLKNFRIAIDSYDKGRHEAHGHFVRA